MDGHTHRGHSCSFPSELPKVLSPDQPCHVPAQPLWPSSPAAFLCPSLAVSPLLFVGFHPLPGALGTQRGHLGIRVQSGAGLLGNNLCSVLFCSVLLAEPRGDFRSLQEQFPFPREPHPSHREGCELREGITPTPETAWPQGNESTHGPPGVSTSPGRAGEQSLALAFVHPLN